MVIIFTQKVEKCIIFYLKYLPFVMHQLLLSNAQSVSKYQYEN